MAVHQCPRCALQFTFRTEVEYHLAADHRPPSLRPQGANDDAADRDRKLDDAVDASAGVST